MTELPDRPIRVLILEDRPEDAELMVRELRRGGFELSHRRVEDEAGFREALEEDPDVVLSDYSLPAMDVPRALALLGEHGRDVPLIVVSGAVGEERAVETIRLGAEDYLLKDRLVRLPTAVEQALRRQSLRRSREEAERQVRRELRQKEVLLQEVHHRVKNNLQLVSSLMSMQLRRLEDGDCARILAKGAARVHSMALVHELLYAPEDLASFELDDYLHRLAALLRTQFDGHEARIEVDAELDGPPFPLDGAASLLDAAILCGLLVTELVSNALEHAFPDGKGGTVRISARRLGPHGLTLTVEDDGRGFAEGFDPRQGESLGWKLVESLTSQMGGTLEVRSGPGLRVTVRAEDALRRG